MSTARPAVWMAVVLTVGCHAQPVSGVADAGAAFAPSPGAKSMAAGAGVAALTEPPSTAAAGGTAVLAQSGPDAGAAVASGPCGDAWRAAQVDVAFKEEPEDTARQRTGPRLERRFQVARQLHGAYRYGDQWASVLEYETASVRGGVSYSLAVPDVLKDLTGQTVSWASHREASGCLTGAGEGEHPALLAADTLRDAKGRLLLLTVPSAPTTPEGQVLLPPGLIPELQVRWEDAGCTEQPGTRARGVRLRFEGSTPVAASAGGTQFLTLNGTRYEVRVVQARVEGPGRCGQAVFTLFREGLRQQREPGARAAGQEAPAPGNPGR